MKALSATLIAAVLLGSAVPALAADEAACKAMWDKADAAKAGVLDSSTAPKMLDAVKASGKPFDADNDGKLTPTEFMEACKADVFTGL